MARSENDLTAGRSRVAHRNPGKGHDVNLFSYFPSATGFFVDNLNGRYKGQKPIALVSRKTIANNPRIIAAVPEI
jgi:hypothetical protein